MLRNFSRPTDSISYLCHYKILDCIRSAANLSQNWN